MAKTAANNVIMATISIKNRNCVLSARTTVSDAHTMEPIVWLVLWASSSLRRESPLKSHQFLIPRICCPIWYLIYSETYWKMLSSKLWRFTSRESALTNVRIKSKTKKSLSIEALEFVECNRTTSLITFLIKLSTTKRRTYWQQSTLYWSLIKSTFWISERLLWSRKKITAWEKLIWVQSVSIMANWEKSSQEQASLIMSVLVMRDFWETIAR